MKIAFYFRNVTGGIKTHVDNLIKQMNILGHETKIIDQNTLGSRMIGDFYGIENGIRRIKGEVEDCDILHIHHTATSSEFLLPLSDVDTPIVNTFHIPTGDSALGAGADVILMLLARLYARRSRAYISVSRRIALKLKRYNRTFVVPNGVDIDRFRPFPRDQGNKFGYLGRLSPEKNLFTLIKAAEDANIYLLIAGKGPLYRRLKAFENEHIKVLGYVGDASSFYRSIDVFILPSLVEAQPIVLLEAMASGLPVIATDVGDNRYLIKGNGIICGTSRKELSSAIESILSMDTVKMGEKSREIAKDYTWDKIAKKIVDIYRSAKNEI